MTLIKKGWFLLVLLVLASCSSDELGPPRDVAYYMEHDEDRKAVIAKCDNDPGRLKLHPNCDNAYKARTRRMLTSGNGRGVPPPPPVAYLTRMTMEEQKSYLETTRGMSREEIEHYNEEHGLNN